MSNNNNLEFLSLGFDFDIKKQAQEMLSNISKASLLAPYYNMKNKNNSRHTIDSLIYGLCLSKYYYNESKSTEYNDWINELDLVKLKESKGLIEPDIHTYSIIVSKCEVSLYFKFSENNYYLDRFIIKTISEKLNRGINIFLFFLLSCLWKSYLNIHDKEFIACESREMMHTLKSIRDSEIMLGNSTDMCDIEISDIIPVEFNNEEGKSRDFAFYKFLVRKNTDVYLCFGKSVTSILSDIL